MTDDNDENGHNDHNDHNDPNDDNDPNDNDSIYATDERSKHQETTDFCVG